MCLSLTLMTLSKAILSQLLGLHRVHSVDIGALWEILFLSIPHWQGESGPSRNPHAWELLYKSSTEGRYWYFGPWMRYVFRAFIQLRSWAWTLICFLVNSGWGSLSLFLAQVCQSDYQDICVLFNASVLKKYPNSRITGLSNSATQKEHIDSTAKLRGLTNLQVQYYSMDEPSLGSYSAWIRSLQRMSTLLSLTNLNGMMLSKPDHARNNSFYLDSIGFCLSR